ncbi:MAG: hypothetical protein K9M54_07745, partial [Kiritimatiellales bacterium]|nr:hypothetical protein [Kiritimatiellales bacterium]
MHSESSTNLFTCQPGFEDLLGEELQRHGFFPSETGRGWLTATGDEPEDSCFAHLRMQNTIAVESTSINAIAAQLVDFFMERIRSVALPEGWPLIFRFADGMTGLGQRVKAVEKEFRVRLKKRMATLERTAGGELPRGG